ncbi:MAG: hypothetical protein KY452_02535 [Actinobacteria bacterium]|nr:hypothetical protein [Actinomycetota bacterium]
MTDGNPVSRPPSLRGVLDADCDLAQIGGVDALAEELYLELPFMPPKARQRVARAARFVAEDLIAKGAKSEYAPARAFVPGCPNFLAYLSFTLWRAEMLEDETLAQRLREALPPEIAEDQRAAVERSRRPHPLEVKVPTTWWNCANCGAGFDEGEQAAVVVTASEGWSHLDYEITYCFDCIGIAVKVDRQANGS